MIRRALTRSLCVVSLLLCAHTAFAAEAGPSSVLRWGGDEQGGAPYVFQDPMEPNRLTGFEVELADALAKKLGQRAKPMHGDWEKLLGLLARGDFDVVINGIEVADEKKRVVLLSHPYFATAEVLTTRKGDASAPRTLAALSGKKLGTLPGSLAERIATSAGAEVRTYEGGQGEIYSDLKLGRTDAVLLDEPIAKYYGDIDPALESTRDGFGTVQYAVALRLDDAAHLDAINAALDGLIQDGTLRAMYERWGIWSPECAALFHDTRAASVTPAMELERWRTAVGRLPPFWERVRTRYPAFLPLFAQGALMTVVVSLCAMALAIVLGLTLAMLRRYGPWPLRAFAVAYIEFFRGTPLLIQLTMIYFGLPEIGLKLDPFIAGVVALGLNYAAAEAENYRAGLESVPRGQLEAAEVLGLTRWQSLRHVVGPQAVRIAIPPMTNDFIALLKDSSLVSVVTLSELAKTYNTLAHATRDELGLGLVVALWYLLIGLPFAHLARRAERYFGKHLARGGAAAEAAK